MMNAENLQTADYLDILFNGRNKDYGAYPIRRYYNQRLAGSMSIVLGFTALVVLVSLPGKSFIANKLNKTSPEQEIILTQYTIPKPVAQPMQALVPARKIQFSTPLIVAANTVADPLPEVAELDKYIIGKITIDGPEVVGNAAPLEVLSQQVTIPVITEHVDVSKIWEKTEITARFPGDWKRFLERNLDYPELARANETQGVVRLQFIVDRTGAISDIVVLNDPGDGLAAEAIRIIRSCPKWEPAFQNGQKVISRHYQSITFQLH